MEQADAKSRPQLPFSSQAKPHLSNPAKAGRRPRDGMNRRIAPIGAFSKTKEE
jgi:hypothetical protein